MNKLLNPLLHNELRLAIISILNQAEFADFNYLLENTKASKGNLSVQLKKLELAKYILISKEYKDNYPYTKCSITSIGEKAFENYRKEIMQYFISKKK